MHRMRFQIGVVTFAPALPPAEWTEGYGTVGGAGRSAAGTPAGYVVREDFLIRVPARIAEGEWDDFVTFLRLVQTGTGFTWWPDYEARPDVSFGVTLESPLPGGEAVPLPDAAYPRVRTLELALRNAAASPFGLDFYAPGEW